MSERRERTATESLLTVAYGVEMSTVVFGAIAIAGLYKDRWLEVLISAVLLIGLLAAASATLRRGLHPIAYASQVVLALPVVTEPLWGVAWVMCIVFWVYCLVKGQQLDRRKEQQ
jgi:pheromone shutdown protein TraB